MPRLDVGTALLEFIFQTFLGILALAALFVSASGVCAGFSVISEWPLRIWTRMFLAVCWVVVSVVSVYKILGFVIPVEVW